MTPAIEFPVAVPSKVKVIDKRLVENNIYSLRVDIIVKEISENAHLKSAAV